MWQGIKGTLSCAVVVASSPSHWASPARSTSRSTRRKSRFARWTRINVRNLAGVPSIVYGLLGLAIFVKALDGVTGGATVFSGGLALVGARAADRGHHGLGGAPRGSAHIREGAFGVGATRGRRRSHVLPAAAPGILTGTVLALARAAGEAAPILLVGAATGLLLTGELELLRAAQGGFTAMPVVIFSYARQTGEDFRAVTAAASLVLVVLILLINGFAIWFRNRYERKW